MTHPLALTFDSGVPGPTLLVFGAVHGDETCGPSAIRRLADEVASDALRLRRGRLTMVPVCNPRAFAQGVRYVEKNLNRVFVPSDAPCAYEERLADALMSRIARCDYLLDLHSMAEGEGAFVFRDFDDGRTREFTAALGVRDVVSGWPALYGDGSGSDTVAFAHSLGKVGACVECGRHGTPEADGVAYAALRNALAHLRMAPASAARAATGSRTIRMEKVFRKEAPGEFVRAWRNFDAVRPGEPVARYADGHVLAAPADGFVVLPFSGARPGDEWFYFGRRDAAA